MKRYPVAEEGWFEDLEMEEMVVTSFWMEDMV
jgi:hypothetical protein